MLSPLAGRVKMLKHPVVVQFEIHRGSQSDSSV